MDNASGKIDNHLWSPRTYPVIRKSVGFVHATQLASFITAFEAAAVPAYSAMAQRGWCLGSWLSVAGVSLDASPSEISAVSYAARRPSIGASRLGGVSRTHALASAEPADDSEAASSSEAAASIAPAGRIAVTATTVWADLAALEAAMEEPRVRPRPSSMRGKAASGEDADSSGLQKEQDDAARRLYASAMQGLAPFFALPPATALERLVSASAVAVAVGADRKLEPLF